eukprot:4889403-Prorocentrum_lima.AAC.1
MVPDDLDPVPEAPDAPVEEERGETEEARKKRLDYEARFETSEKLLPVGPSSMLQVTVFGHSSGSEFPSYIS